MPVKHKIDETGKGGAAQTAQAAEKCDALYLSGPSQSAATAPLEGKRPQQAGLQCFPCREPSRQPGPPSSMKYPVPSSPGSLSAGSRTCLRHCVLAGAFICPVCRQARLHRGPRADRSTPALRLPHRPRCSSPPSLHLRPALRCCLVAWAARPARLACLCGDLPRLHSHAHLLHLLRLLLRHALITGSRDDSDRGYIYSQRRCCRRCLHPVGRCLLCRARPRCTHRNDRAGTHNNFCCRHRYHCVSAVALK